MKAIQNILTLDVGTTALKGVLFDLEGRMLASALREYELDKPAPDILELDADLYWQSTITVIRQLLQESGVPPSSIAAVGVTSQGETLIVLGKDGRPLRPAMVWLDNRTGAEAAEIGEKFPLDNIYRITGQQEVIPAWPATRIRWIRKHEPRLFEKAARYLLVEDYLLYRLTGRFVTDRALNPSTLYYDIITREWWPEMLNFLQISAKQLPELVDSGTAVGMVSAEAAAATGLDKRTKVTTAPIDQVAGAVGAGNLDPGIVTETTGAALALCACLDRPIYDPRKRLGLYAHAEKGRYVLLPWVPTAGMALRWFRDEFGGGRSYTELCREAESIPPGAEGLLILPHLAGAGCPDFDPKARGVFWGLTLGHRRGHLVRALLESIAFILRRNLELLHELGLEIGEIRSLGGAARSDLWLKIKADICRHDLLVMECEETTSLGTAMLACLGAGIYRNLHEAREKMTRVSKRVTHDPAMSDVYDDIYRQHIRLNDQTKLWFHSGKK